MKRAFAKLARSGVIRSVSGSLRHQRFALLEKMVAQFSPPVRILDVGGTDAYWTNLGQSVLARCEVTVLNPGAHLVGHAGIDAVIGDARDMSQFTDNAFDIVYSNSVIEHVGDLADQMRMASEVRRVGKGYIVQTPNRYFPIEPHFYVPFFQFMPLELRARLLQRFDLGWFHKTPNKDLAMERVRSVQLLTRRQLQRLFPEAEIIPEHFMGLEKSFSAYHL